MSHKSTTIHSIRCDHKEDGEQCDSRVEYERGNKSFVIHRLRKEGWSVLYGEDRRAGGEHYCPLHNTKPTPECPECGSVLMSSHPYRDLRCRLCGAEFPEATISDLQP